MVEVLEFARLLGGSGGVPTDGTWATLGLGEAQGRSRAKLFCETKEEAEHIPEGRRIPLLIASMGKDVFEEAKKSERKTMQTLHRQRQQTVEQEEPEWDHMPGSLKEARERAMKLASETEREAKRTWTAHRTPSRWGTSDVQFQRPEGATVPEAWPEAAADAEPKPMGSASPTAAEKAPPLEPSVTVPSGVTTVNVAKEPVPDTVPDAVLADMPESTQEETLSLDPSEPAVEAMVEAVNPCAKKTQNALEVVEAVEAVEVKEDDPKEAPTVSKDPDPAEALAQKTAAGFAVSSLEEAAPEPSRAVATADVDEPLPSPSSPRPRNPRWCDLSEASPEAKSVSFGEEYHFPSHRQVLLKTELTPPPPPVRAESVKDHEDAGNSCQGKIAPSQAKARKSTREGPINGRHSAEPKVWGRPKILQRQVRDEAEDAQQPPPLPAATVVPPAPPRGAKHAAVPPPPVLREVPTPPTATNWLGTGEDPIRILQRKAPPAEEAEDSDEEEAPPVRRSWRCARAGKSERVVTARYKHEVSAGASAGARSNGTWSKGSVSKGLSDREAVPNRFSKTVSQPGAAQAAQATQAQAAQAAALSSAAAWLGEQVPVSRRDKGPERAKAAKVASPAPATASQSWKPSLRSALFTQRH